MADASLWMNWRVFILPAVLTVVFLLAVTQYFAAANPYDGRLCNHVKQMADLVEEAEQLSPNTTDEFNATVQELNASFQQLREDLQQLRQQTVAAQSRPLYQVSDSILQTINPLFPSPCFQQLYQGRMTDGCYMYVSADELSCLQNLSSTADETTTSTLASTLFQSPEMRRISPLVLAGHFIGLISAGYVLSVGIYAGWRHLS